MRKRTIEWKHSCWMYNTTRKFNWFKQWRKEMSVETPKPYSRRYRNK